MPATRSNKPTIAARTTLIGGSSWLFPYRRLCPIGQEPYVVSDILPGDAIQERFAPHTNCGQSRVGPDGMP
jgi:hypothetical protein